MPASLRAALCLFLCSSSVLASQSRNSGSYSAQRESGALKILHAVVTGDLTPTPSRPFILAEPGDTVLVDVTNNHQEHKVRVVTKIGQALNLQPMGGTGPVLPGQTRKYRFYPNRRGKYEARYDLQRDMIVLDVHFVRDDTTKQPPSRLSEVAPLPLGFDVGQHSVCPSHDFKDMTQKQWSQSELEVQMCPAHDLEDDVVLSNSQCVINVNDGHAVDPRLRNAECFTNVNGKWQQQEEDTTCEQATSHSLESNCRTIDWSSERDRRACLAGMVSLVYCAIEHQNVMILKPEWLSDSTGFDLFGDPLEHHGEIYAAVYRYGGMDKSAPHYMFVFRGTSFCRLKTAIYDFRVNCGIIFKMNPLCCDRFRSAYRNIQDLVKSLKDPVVWLIGHSQGAWLALNVGREMMLKGHNLSTFLFNPPLAVACWYDCLKWVCEMGCRAAEAIQCKKGINSMLMEDQLHKLRDWAPYVYAHERDWVFCRCFIRYFEHPKDLDKRVMVLPSVVLCKNSGAEASPHALKNWLNSNTDLEYECTRYPVSRREHPERVDRV